LGLLVVCQHRLVSESDSTPEDGRIRRRTLVRLLVGLGIGIPILIELATFLGLVEQSLLGGGTGDEAGTDGGTGDATTTPTARRAVGPGDELLPDTVPTETLSAASVRATQDAWVFDATVEVSNHADEDYVLQLTAVTTDGGTTVDGETATVRVPAGETATAAGQWALPPGERPATMRVVTSMGGEPTRTHDVALGSVPVQGS
jgi:hypothetical protein